MWHIIDSIDHSKDSFGQAAGQLILHDNMQTCNLFPLHSPPTCSAPWPPTVTPRALRLALASVLNAACWHFVIQQPLLCNLANVHCMWQLFLLPPHTNHQLCSGCKRGAPDWKLKAIFVMWKGVLSREEGGGSKFTGLSWLCKIILISRYLISEENLANCRIRLIIIDTITS